MREIKFRAWDKKEKRFYYSDRYSGGYWGDIIIDEKNLPLQEFTGPKDKNGVEIYEGDIIGYWADACWVVTWGDYRWTCGYSLNEPTFTLTKKLALTKTVIGNIYRNPELLEDKDET